MRSDASSPIWPGPATRAQRVQNVLAQLAALALVATLLTAGPPGHDSPPGGEGLTTTADPGTDDPGFPDPGIADPGIAKRNTAHPAMVGETSTTPRREPQSPPIPLPATGPAVIDALHPGSGFRHPGVLVSVPQLEFVRARLRAGDLPWTDAYRAMADSKYAELDWKAEPRAVVQCGPYSVPDLGCSDEVADGIAVHTQALMWYLTGNRAYAQSAVDILDAWSAVLQGHTGKNSPIQAAWSAVPFVRGAEILRHTYPDWPPDAVDRTANMFRSAFLPLVADGGGVGAWGNWDFINLDAAQAIAVFLDERGLFDRAVGKWRARLPAYVYLASDGPYPVGPPGVQYGPQSIIAYWFGQQSFVEGLTQETCRDLGHAGWGLAAATHVAETARIQGVDLYGEGQPRLVAAYEFQAAFALGDPVPASVCGGQLKKAFGPTPEMALNHYANRQKVPMPRTATLVLSRRPQGASFFYGWETLTHAGNPN